MKECVWCKEKIVVSSPKESLCLDCWVLFEEVGLLFGEADAL